MKISNTSKIVFRRVPLHMVDYSDLAVFSLKTADVTWCEYKQNPTSNSDACKIIVHARC